MSVYDRAHDLAKALKNSDEYKALLTAKNGIVGDDQAKNMVKDFLAKQMELEYEMMAGKTEDKAKTEKLQKMYELIMLNNKAGNFLQAHFRFQRMMADVYKIIGESVAEGLDIFAKE